MHDGAASALQRLEGAGDQLLAGLHQHLDGDIVGDLLFLDQPANEVVVGLAGRGKADLDLLDADLDQQLPETTFLGDVHRLEQRLVAVTQIDAGPDRCPVDGAVRPLAVAQGHGRRAGGICDGRRRSLILLLVGAVSGCACLPVRGGSGYLLPLWGLGRTARDRVGRWQSIAGLWLTVKG